ncbi:MAG: hypothetical protein AAFV72_10435 [Cyanobacteria bacterium J06635_1]
MDFDSQRAQDLLQALKLGDLFVSALGWSPPQGIGAIATQFLKQPYRCRCLAQRGDTTVWEIKISRKGKLTPQIRGRLYQTIAKQYPSPLLIFTEASRTRSLWHWQQRLGEQSVAQCVVFIAGQPAKFWQSRLEKIWAYAPGAEGISLLPDWPVAGQMADLTTTFGQQVQLLYEAIDGISHGADRWRYAGLLLTRLIFVFGLQRQGLLNEGDIWYLHTLFGQSQQRGRDLFFRQVLQPLFSQGFALPEPERPLRIVKMVGKLPFIGSLFENPFELQYPDVGISDAPFESILVWFGEPIWEWMLDPWRSAALSAVFEQQVFSQTGRGYPSHPLLVAQCCDRTLAQYILQQLGTVASPEQAALPDRLFQADLGLCRQLIQAVLPQLHVLDPACGSGTFLLASLQWLVELYSVLIGHLQHIQDAQLGIWLSALSAEQPSHLQGIYRRLLQNTLYGVDRSAAAIDIAQLQLMGNLCASATTPADLEALPALDFNLLTGNSLVGLIRVDEQGFDRIKVRGKGAAQAPDALQGNLLQPLAADSYRTILAEKNITLEHYKSQTSLLEELQGIPQYAQMAFLRDSLNQLNRKAQFKLNALLLNQFTQKLGIQYRETQLTERPRRRLLRTEDLELLQPFHWGYFFAPLIKQYGGFSVIISAPPWGAFRPTPEEFFTHFQDMRQGDDSPPFKTSKQALLDEDPELAEAWLFYQSQYGFVSDYFNRTEQYAHQRLPGQRSSLRLDWLFAEQCFNLLRPQGLCALVMPPDLALSDKGVVLRGLLDQGGQFQVSEPLPKDLLPKARSPKDPKAAKLPTFCLVSFDKNARGG